MREQHDWFFGMINTTVRKARLIINNQRDAVFAGDVSCLDYRKFIPWDTGLEMDVCDSPSCDGASDSSSVDHSRKRQVVDVFRPASDLIAAFFAQGGAANKFCHLRRQARGATA